MGTTPIAPAFPEIAAHFQVPEQHAGLIITFYTLGGLALSLLEGVLADRFGRKLILLPSLILFGAGGALCATAATFHRLLFWRAVQGVGGAVAPFMYIVMVGDLYQGNMRTEAVGYAGAVRSVGTMVYPLAGGTLALMGWYWPFFLPLAAIPVAFAAALSLRTPEPKPRKPLQDYLRESWQGMRQRRFAWLYVCYGTTAFMYFGAYLTHFSFRLRHSFHSSTLHIGALFSISALAVAVTSWRLRPLKDRIGRHNLVTSSYLGFALGFLLIPLVGKEWLMVLPAIILGIAWGANAPSIQDLLAGPVPLERRAVQLSLMGLSLRIGNAVGPVSEDSVLNAWGIDAVFYVAAILSILMFVVALLTVRRQHQAQTQ